MANNSESQLTFLENELSAYRAENDRLAQELALCRRTIAAFPLAARRNPGTSVVSPVRLPRPICAGDDIVFNIDRCETGERLIYIVGWAFCPRIDCTEASVSLLLESTARAFVVKPDRADRPDVAAAHRGREAGPIPAAGGSGGASRLAQSGFAVLLERSLLDSGSTYAVAIQIDGPDFSVRKPAGLALNG